MIGVYRAVQSASNLRDLGQGLEMYANDNSGHLPNKLGDIILSDHDLLPEFFVVAWGQATAAMGATPQALRSAINGGGHCSYQYFLAGKMIADVKPDEIMICENDGLSPSGQTGCVFGDGHVELLTPAQLIGNFILQKATIQAAFNATSATTTSVTAR